MAASGKGVHWVTEPTERRPIIVGETGIESLPPRTVVDMLRERVANSGGKLALQLNRDGEVLRWTWQQYYDAIYTAAKSLVHLGTPAMSGVCIIGFNSPEWLIADVAAIMAGAIPAGIYTTNNAEACEYVIGHCKASIIFVENKKQLEKILAVRPRLPHLKHIVQWADTANLPEGVMSWADFMALGAEVPDSAVEERVGELHPAECATLIYTSGTTGPPKAVMVSHDNLTWSSALAMSLLELTDETVSISYLPLSHIAAQMLDIILPIAAGATLHFAKPDALKGTLGQTLQEVRPTMFLGVPRVWEKVMEKMKAVGAGTTGLKKTIADWAKAKGLEGHYNEQRGEGKPWGWFFAEHLVFSKVKAALGLDRCRYMSTAAAPIALETLEYFMSLDLPLMELYGMSETTGLISVSVPAAYKTKACGRTAPGTEVKLENPDAEGNGEICSKGRQVFMGYMYGEKDTRECFDADGFLHTGDIGRFDSDGFLYITGRIKELLITAGGENVAPIPIEECIKKEMQFVSNAVVIGDRRKFLSCLLTIKVNPDAEGEPTQELSRPALASLASFGIEGVTTVAELKAHPELERVLAAGFERCNRQAVSNAQMVRKWIVIDNDFSLSTGELTATMKLKRKVVNQRYEAEIEGMYAGGGGD